MTTIAFRNGMIAADSAVCFDSSHVGTMRKLARSTDERFIAGAAGHTSAAAAFLAWVANNCEGPPPATDERADGLLYSHRDGLQCWDGAAMVWPMHCEFTAIGSGYRQAMAAMAMGADAFRAVEIAALTDVYTRGPFHFLSLPRSKP